MEHLDLPGSGSYGAMHKNNRKSKKTNHLCFHGLTAGIDIIGSPPFLLFEVGLRSPDSVTIQKVDEYHTCTFKCLVLLNFDSGE